MKKKLLLLIVLLCTAMFTISAQTPTGTGLVKRINEADFKKFVTNYSSDVNSWTFKLSKPVIIDFYADWCGPCRKLSPIVEELAKEYKGKIDFYKINIDENKNLATKFQVSSIPMLLFIPVNGKPQAITGLHPKAELIKAIDYIFYNKKEKK